ncbi:MAG: hypothetical protein CVV27_18675, partial [Candidatus Melainabacteria bacterium HGW-Melainabacteria-1]
LKQRYVKQELPKLHTPGYDGFQDRDWNNAMLMSYQHYNAEQDKLEAIFESLGRSIPKLMEFLKQPDVMRHFR